MNNTELDRRLREWLEPGAETAREAVVWEVIEQAEHTPQRPRWRTAASSLSDRAGSIFRPVGVVAVALLVVALVASLAARNVGQRDADSRAFITADLDTILVWDDTKPETWHLDNLVSNPDAVLITAARSMSDEEWLDQPAFRSLEGARYTDFTGVDAVFMSWGAVFPSVGDARDAFGLIAEELGSDAGWGLGSGAAVELGDEGNVFTGATTKLGGRDPTDPVGSRMYLWRHGNVVLALGGWFDYDETELESVARGMDDRARRLVAP
jgi:hypothetical protein